MDLRSAQPVEEADGTLDPGYLPDVIIANAGVGGINPAKFSVEVNETVMGINFFGTVNTITPFLKRMCDRKSGHIVAISSLASLRGLPSAASYCASKAAQNSLMESWRLDLARYNIQVSTILPGFIKTAMADHDEFDMPFTVSSEAAARATLSAIAKKKKRYLFPWPMRFFASINKMLPVWLYDFLMPRLNRDAAKSEAVVLCSEEAPVIRKRCPHLLYTKNHRVLGEKDCTRPKKGCCIKTISNQPIDCDTVKKYALNTSGDAMINSFVFKCDVSRLLRCP